MITSLILLLFFSYGHLYGTLKAAGLGASVARRRYLAPAAAVLFLGGAVWILKSLRDAQPATRVLNLVSAALLVFPMISIVSYRVGSPAVAPQETQDLRLPAGQVSPGIYYIVVDGYARQDTLQAVYELDNEPFLQALEEWGFYVARGARSNYAQTSLALASALNVDYVEALMPEQERGREPLWDPIQDRVVRRQLEDLGYETAAFSTGLGGTEWRDADRRGDSGTVRKDTRDRYPG
ncbi:MAG: hypothetical protein O6949_03930 [Chloroflexi bacterium]|nr:hypothetical protein [Chloroflexota bacterium]